ncbi:hypothetical protein BS50DRAFT_359292 [Corynespora cassiicola Philippines]|uniref:Uncharacterized protein n=1 Tax=Corynespora cassiicola Philippines TaxID=1448308 RepID=A0A2T2NS70_CORCC|nr:hypothetical protein BS50DRAFT_359292 [Corynespora cassiicola Philippines]
MDVENNPQFQALLEQEKALASANDSNRDWVTPATGIFSKESFVCRGGLSHTHQLACFHSVYTAEETRCGSNCIDVEEETNQDQPFACTLCLRWKMVQEGKVPSRTSQPADLFLPDFPKVDLGLTPGTPQYRPSEPMYVEGEQFLLVRTEADIALVRYNEHRQIQANICTIESAAKTLYGTDAHLADIIKDSKRFYEICINNFHHFGEAGHNEIASASFLLGAKISDPKAMRQQKMNRISEMFKLTNDLFFLLIEVESLIFPMIARKQISVNVVPRERGL